MAEVSPAELVREAIANLELPTTPSEIVRYVQHGVWEIADADGELVVRMVQPPGKAEAAAPKINARAKRVAEEPEPEAAPRGKGAKAPAQPEPKEGDDDMPPKDADVANMLKENLGMLEEGLKPYPDQSAMGKFPRPFSPHDMLLADGGGNMVLAWYW